MCRKLQVNKQEDKGIVKSPAADDKGEADRKRIEFSEEDALDDVLRKFTVATLAKGEFYDCILTIK